MGLRLDLHEEEAPEVAVVALAHCVAQQVAVVVELGDDAARLLGVLHAHGASTGGAATSQIGGFGVRRAAAHLGAYRQVHVRRLAEAAEVVLEHRRARRPLEPRLVRVRVSVRVSVRVMVRVSVSVRVRARVSVRVSVASPVKSAASRKPL